MTLVIEEVDARDVGRVQSTHDAARASAGAPRDGMRERECCALAFDAPSGAQTGAWSEGRRAAVFDKERARLQALAARVLGSRAEAEDVVQDVWFRWREADVEAVRVPQAWLATATVRLAIDRLRKQRRERIGEHEAPGAMPWLDGIAPSAEEAGLRAARLADGLLMLLERLGPLEQAVFVLREAFECDYAEIAALTGCTPVHCRQIVRRARVRLAREPTLRSIPPADAAQHARAVERLREVLHAQDRAGLMDLLGVTATALVAAGATVGAAVPHVGAEARAGAEAGGRATPVRNLRAEMLALDGEPGVALVAEHGASGQSGIWRRGGALAARTDRPIRRARQRASRIDARDPATDAGERVCDTLIDAILSSGPHGARWLMRQPERKAQGISAKPLPS
jgi:RNA polymerase sigma factor (sigma-70 family)